MGDEVFIRLNNFYIQKGYYVEGSIHWLIWSAFLFKVLYKLGNKVQPLDYLTEVNSVHAFKCFYAFTALNWMTMTTYKFNSKHALTEINLHAYHIKDVGCRSIKYFMPSATYQK